MKLLSAILFFILPQFSLANTIVVGKDQLVTSLKKAIELAGPDDTILLRKGIYREGNIIIDKPVRLIGIDHPVLDGEHKYEILTVTGERVLIKGIHFRNAGYSSMNDYAAINLVDAAYAIIENNLIEHSYFAIHVANANNCIISNNSIYGKPLTEQTSGNGIHLWKCSDMIVELNEISGHRDGIYFEFVTNSTIWNNNSHNNIRYGLHFMFSNNDAYLENTFRQNGAGVAVMYSHHVLMHSNEFENNWGANAYGLLLKEISDAKIFRNNFTRNTVGILMESTNRVDVLLNNFRSNGWAQRIQASCDQNYISFNNFYGNSFDVATNGSTMLSNFNNNYWDKYEGYDMNRDVIGDVPYHPVSMYSMVIEQNPNAVILLRSFMVALLDRAEKAMPGLTPELLVDNQPLMEAVPL
jgi:nitrous oxidase accessory protein